MASHTMGDEQAWKKAFERDPELGACIRKASIIVIEELTPYAVRRAKELAEQILAYTKERQERLEDLTHEIGCLDEITQRIAAFSGEGELLKSNLEDRRKALLEEKKEIEDRLKPEDLPARVEHCLKTYDEMRVQKENAEFFLKIIDGGSNAPTGGVPGVADEPRSGGDNGASSDPLCDL